MRVLLITGEYPPDCGGVADYTREIARALVDFGSDVGVLTSALRIMSLRPGPHPLAPSPCPGLTPSPPLQPQLERGEQDPWPVSRTVGSWSLRALPELRRRILGEDRAIVHIQYQTAAYGMSPAINLLPLLLRGRRRTVVTMHDLRVPYLFPKAGAIRTLANRTLVASADAAVLTNEGDLAAAARWRRDGRHLIPIGSNIPVAPPPGYDREAFRRSLGLEPDELLLGYFGLLNASKGVETLVEAVARVRSYGLRVRLVLIGEEVGAADPTNAGSRGAVLARIERLGIRSVVIQTGRLAAPMVSAHLLALDLCVLPFRDGASFRRGSLMAALAHGLPIVTTRPPSGLEPPLRDEQEALLVQPDDPAALAATISRALTVPVVRTRIAAGARRAGERFNWPAIARQTLEVYEEIT